jgi:hypothetical protein
MGVSFAQFWTKTCQFEGILEPNAALQRYPSAAPSQWTVRAKPRGALIPPFLGGSRKKRTGCVRIDLILKKKAKMKSI